MTRYLFIDNFRGFSNTYIPVADVNFLVGENSSGKTSVLCLLKLLSTNEFIWQQKFRTEDVNFGHFDDMVSAHSSDRSYFSFGIIDDHPAGSQYGALSILYTFKEHEGMPRLEQVTTVGGNRQLLLRFEGKRIYCKTKDLPKDLTVDNFRQVTMPEWVAERSSSRSDYRLLAESPRYPHPTQHLYYPLMMAIEQSHKKGETKDTPLNYMRAEMVWIAPIRTKPSRTYDDISQSDFSPEGSHTPYLIRRTLQSETEAKTFADFIQRVGKASGLFESIRINSYGKGVTAPFEVDVVIEGKQLNVINVGYGVSQSLPVFAEIITRPRGSWFAIQQPEVHLHPRAQAALGDAFFEMATVDKKCFFIETHSDFTIDRFRMNFRGKRSKTPNGQVLFFERRDKHNTVTSLPIDSQGDLPSDQPDSYRRFFIAEELDILGL
jgi:hypothetical protein